MRLYFHFKDAFDPSEASETSHDCILTLSPPKHLRRRVTDAEFDPTEHKRGGNPENTGQFSSSGGGSASTSKPSEAAPYAKHQEYADTIIKKFGLSPIKIITDDLTGHAMARSGGPNNVVVDTNNFTPENIAKYGKEWHGISVGADPDDPEKTAQSLIAHEIGHSAVHQIVGQPPVGSNRTKAYREWKEHFAKVHDTIQRYYDKANGGGVTPISVYAQEDPSEFAAEAFAAMHLGPPDFGHMKEWMEPAQRHAEALWDELFKLKPGQEKTHDLFDPNEARDPTGKWTATGGVSEKSKTEKQTVSFVSPNADPDQLSFSQAQKGLKSPRQKLLAGISHKIDSDLGIKDVRVNHVIGAWSDGAENSVMTNSASTDPDVEMVAAVMKGYLANQKAVLLFHPVDDHSGHQTLASFRTSGDIAEIHDKLLKAGVEFHTLEPRGNDTIVHFYTDSEEDLANFASVAKQFGARVKAQSGTGQFIPAQTKEDGTDAEQREFSRQAYEQAIERVEAAGKLRSDFRSLWENHKHNWERETGERTGRGEQPESVAPGAAPKPAGEPGERPEQPAGRGGAQSLEQAQRSAEASASGQPPLEGLPTEPHLINGDYYVPGPVAKIREIADNYMKSAGIPYDPPKKFLPVDKDRATRVADAFTEMKHDPDDPKVKKAYAAMAKETIAQWQAIKDSGLEIEWIKDAQSDPYAATPRLAAMDVQRNNHWWGYSTDIGFGTPGEASAEEATHNNPMLQMTDEVVGGRRCCVNDLFRITHDYFGHFKEGVGFHADGEENAWRMHAAMYSKEALPAVTTEARGQNSWVNYGPHGDTNRTALAADITYAPQKIGLMPEWTYNEGREDTDKKKTGDAYDPSEARDPSGQWTGGGSSSTTLPKTPADIVSSKVSLGEVYRGTGSAQDPANLHSSLGDLGQGVYLTQNRQIAKSFGGGPQASVSKGTRQVHAYTMPELFPEEVAFVFGGKRIDSPVTLVDGNGLKIWEGDWKAENIERALADEPGIKAVVGTPDSIGLNQIAIRDPSILRWSKPTKDRRWNLLHFHTRDGIFKIRLRDKEFVESEHPRGQPGNAGKFVSGGGTVAETKTTKSEAKPAKKTKKTKAPAEPRLPSSTPLRNSQGHPGLISTALPQGKQNEFNKPTLELAKTDADKFALHIKVYKDNPAAYPLQESQLTGDDDTVARKVIDHIKSNLKFIYDQTPKDVRDHTKKWYDGARHMVDEHVATYKEHGLKDTTVAALYASLSPNNLWDQNVAQGDRMLDIYYNHRDDPWNKKMDTAITKIKNKTIKALALDIVGSSYDELDTPEKRGLWIRVFDQSRWPDDPDYKVYTEGKDPIQPFHRVTPEGTREKWYMTSVSKKPQALSWQSTAMMANAVKVLESDGDRNIISDALSGEDPTHKVRSFYNNILAPNSENEDVTMDTHAVDAAWLMDDPIAVLHNFGKAPQIIARPEGWVRGTPGSVKTGLGGNYAFNAEAYRELAHELKIQPRQLQSIVWETKREWLETMTDDNHKRMRDVWEKYRTGDLTQAQAQTDVKKIIDEDLALTTEQKKELATAKRKAKAASKLHPVKAKEDE